LLICILYLIQKFKKLHNKAKYFLILISLSVISIPILLFPLSGDLSVMFLGGKSIANGGKIYIDFIDIKQPFIYYFFAISNILFGDSEIAPRILDYIIQLSTAIITFFVVMKITGKSIIAFLSSLTYIIVYISLNYSNTAQCESYTGLILILLIHFLMKDETKVKEYFIIGALIGILGGLKITFLMILFALPILNIPNDNDFWRKSIIKLLSFLSGLILLLFLTHLPLSDVSIFSGFKDALSFLAFYSDFPPINADFIRESLKKTAIFFGDNYSILLFFASVWVFKLYLTDKIEARTKKLLNIAFIFTIFLFLSVVIERKMMEYHFSRFLLPISIVSSFGIYNLYKVFIEKFKKNSSLSRLILSVIAVFFLLFSPLPRYFNMFAMSYFYFFNKDAYNQMYSDENSSSNNRIEQLEVINNLKNINKSDFVLVINSGGNIINHKLGCRITGFGHSCFYLSVLKLDAWRKKFYDELTAADWLVIQKNDRHYFMTRTNMSSYELIMNEPVFSDFIRKAFKFKTELNNYVILKNKLNSE